MRMPIYMAAVVAFVSVANAHAQEATEEKLSIDWDSAKAAAVADAQRDQSGVEKFRAAVPSGLEKVRVPVLVTGTGPVRAAPQVKAQDTSYAAIYLLDRDATLSIMGTALSIVVTGGDATPADVPDYQAGDFTILDDDADAKSASQPMEADYSFFKFGAAYTLRLSCKQQGDKRCLEPDFAKSVASSLVQVGGSPE
ncbi:hypothetical protein N2601_08810 [Rhizobium sp. CB3060]|uniref:hypothetical protein n=1 Tax=Rhizobium sp. CB3060 TaxID=3138255 RepID=UPI0021A834DA|nr:hypothetical protein [Rhizobium tropici]UWU23028.1 hypothetical protein N2601_08810 [Rhizobium tropici]